MLYLLNLLVSVILGALLGYILVMSKRHDAGTERFSYPKFVVVFGAMLVVGFSSMDIDDGPYGDGFFGGAGKLLICLMSLVLTMKILQRR